MKSSIDPAKAGFSLLELVVVIAILAILLGMGLVAFRSYQANAQLKLAGEELAAALRYARQLAMKEGGATVDFSPLPGGAAQGYAVYHQDGSLAKQLTLPGTVTLSMTDWGPVVNFLQNGSADDDGQIVLNSTAKSRQVTITLNRVTGAVTRD